MRGDWHFVGDEPGCQNFKVKVFLIIKHNEKMLVHEVEYER